ncbi:MAG: hypothetical protein OEN50_15630 [Deltaproteobacteria bacterium]|nr:hypothetical protein [Deltaproteobacteria bacterium]
MQKNPRRYSKFLTLLFLGATFFSGCASKARIESMVVSQAPGSPIAKSRYEKSIFLGEVTGGEPTNPLWIPEVGNPEFREALYQTLQSQGLLSTQQETSMYVLTVNLLGLSQPAFGLDFTVTSHVNYLLTKRTTGEVVLAATLKAPYTATTGDAYFAATRLQLGNEGSIKANIEMFLRRLYETP